MLRNGIRGNDYQLELEKAGIREIGGEQWTTERDRLRERYISINGGGGGGGQKYMQICRWVERGVDR